MLFQLLLWVGNARGIPAGCAGITGTEDGAGTPPQPRDQELRSCCCSGFGDASRALLRCAGHSGTLSTVLALFGAQEPCLSPPAAFGTGRAQLKGAGNAALLEPEYPWMSETKTVADGASLCL